MKRIKIKKRVIKGVPGITHFVQIPFEITEWVIQNTDYIVCTGIQIDPAKKDKHGNVRQKQKQVRIQYILVDEHHPLENILSDLSKLEIPFHFAN